MINEQARSLLKVAILQLHVVKEKTKNILNTVKKINEASEAGAKLIILPVSIWLSLTISGPGHAYPN